MQEGVGGDGRKRADESFVNEVNCENGKGENQSGQSEEVMGGWPARSSQKGGSGGGARVMHGK